MRILHTSGLQGYACSLFFYFHLQAFHFLLKKIAKINVAKINFYFSRVIKRNLGGFEGVQAYRWNHHCLSGIFLLSVPRLILFIDYRFHAHQSFSPFIVN